MASSSRSPSGVAQISLVAGENDRPRSSGEHLVRGRRGDSPGADCGRRTRNSPPTSRRRRAAAATEAACSYRSAGIVRSVDAPEMAAVREGTAQDRYVAADRWWPDLFAV